MPNFPPGVETVTLTIHIKQRSIRVGEVSSEQWTSEQWTAVLLAVVSSEQWTAVLLAVVSSKRSSKNIINKKDDF